MLGSWREDGLQLYEDKKKIFNMSLKPPSIFFSFSYSYYIDLDFIKMQRKPEKILSKKLIRGKPFYKVKWHGQGKE